MKNKNAIDSIELTEEERAMLLSLTARKVKRSKLRYAKDYKPTTRN